MSHTTHERQLKMVTILFFLLEQQIYMKSFFIFWDTTLCIPLKCDIFLRNIR
jgi:hypothetical protein